MPAGVTNECVWERYLAVLPHMPIIPAFVRRYITNYIAGDPEVIHAGSGPPAGHQCPGQARGCPQQAQNAQHIPAGDDVTTVLAHQQLLSLWSGAAKIQLQVMDSYSHWLAQGGLGWSTALNNTSLEARLHHG